MIFAPTLADVCEGDSPSPRAVFAPFPGPFLSKAEGRPQAAQRKLSAGLDVRLRGPDGGSKGERIAALRQMMAGLECASLSSAEPSASLPLGLPELQAHLPGFGPGCGPGFEAGGAGLACGVLHEIAAAAHGDRPAAFGFSLALMACAQQARTGPAVFVASRRCLADFGNLYGHGLHQHGLDVGRLLLVETRTDKDALWAIEESLRSQAAPAMVAGALALLVLGGLWLRRIVRSEY